MIFHVTAKEFVLWKQMKKYSLLHYSEQDSPGSEEKNSRLLGFFYEAKQSEASKMKSYKTPCERQGILTCLRKLVLNNKFEN